MANFGERLSNAIDAIEAQKGGKADVIDASPSHAILKVTFPGINPKRPGGTEIVNVKLGGDNQPKLRR